jgi:hypothetical protein
MTNLTDSQIKNVTGGSGSTSGAEGPPPFNPTLKNILKGN